jgi:hypothetical protein
MGAVSPHTNNLFKKCLLCLRPTFLIVLNFAMFFKIYLFKDSIILG